MVAPRSGCHRGGTQEELRSFAPHCPTFPVRAPNIPPVALFLTSPTFLTNRTRVGREK